MRLTWQVSPRNKLSAYFDEIDKYRGHDMQSNEDPEEASLQWFSPAYHTAQVKWTSTVSSRMLLEAGWSSNLEYYTNSYQPGVGKPRCTPEWFASASRLENLQGGRRMAATAENTQSPERQNLQASVSYVTGSHNIKFGMQYQWGDFMHSVDANADLTQQYRSPVGTPKWSVPDSVIVRNTPLVYGERLNRDFGIYAQDSWRLKQLTLNAGHSLGERRRAGARGRVAGRTLGAGAPVRGDRERPELERLGAARSPPSTTCSATAGRRSKYSLNRYNQSRTTGIAATYNPLASLTSAVAAVARPERRRHRAGHAHVQPRRHGHQLRLHDAGLRNRSDGPARRTSASVALNEYGAYPRTWNLESALELQHEIMRGLSGTVSWFRGNFHNLTTTINRSYTHADYTPYTVYNPLDRRADSRSSRARCSNRGRRAISTPTIRSASGCTSRSTSSSTRGPAAASRCSAVSPSNVSSTSPARRRTIPTRCASATTTRTASRTARASSCPARCRCRGASTLSGVLQSNHGTASSRTMVADARHARRYPATCPAPCPAGQIILPTAIFGQTSLTVNLVDGDTVYTERINQLDLRVGKTFAFGRIRITPSLEIFNVNNSDAIITYASTNALNAGSSYLRPNSIMQPRMIGFNVVTRW